MPERFKVTVDFYVMAHDANRARDAVAINIPAIEDMINDGFITGDDVVRLQSDDLGVKVSDAEFEAAKNWAPDDTYFQGYSDRCLEHGFQKYWAGR